VSDLSRLLFPRSVAIVGASPRREDTIETTLRSGVRTWGVNPGREAVGELRCYPSVADLPEIPDVAFVLVGHERVEEAVRDALAAGVRGFVVPGVGAEAGAAAREVSARLAAIVREAGAEMVGPNCMGVFVPEGPSTWIGSPTGADAPGHVAVLCQSGSIADALLSLGGRIGMRCVISSGGEAATDAADYLDFFADDGETRAVGLFLETVRRPAAFAEALARLAEAEKPVVCLKVGRSDAAAHAALSHTGALVGSVEAFSAMLHRYGAIEVHDFHELVETLEILGRGRWPRGPRIGAISESGGECALFADQAEAAGIPFQPLPRELAARLQGEFPNYLHPGNPLDAWAVADEGLVFPRSLELMAESGAYDVLLGLVDLSQFRDRGNDPWCELTLRALARLAGEHEDLFVAGVSVHSSDPPTAFQELAREHDLALLRGPRDALCALANVARWRPARVVGDGGDAPDVSDLLRPGLVPEHESALVLERYGVPFAPHRRAETPDEAAVAAVELGFPVVIKTDGAAHKAREGGVVLGVSTALEAAEEARRFGGRVLVARQIDPADEAICGMTRDPDYGPVLAVGPGGVAVEALNRLTLTLAPLDLETAREVVAEAGVVDVGDVVAATLVALGRLALRHPEVESVDVNPLVLRASGAVAVDALVVVRAPEEPPDDMS
jgi:acyl-CoA synthetase (NDP forming)